MRILRASAFLCFSAAATLLACGDEPGTQPPPKTPGPVLTGDAGAAEQGSAKNEPLQLAGVDLDAMDQTQSPCDDFYQFACGNWLKKTQIPAEEAAWSRSFSVMRDRNEEILHGILEAYARGEGRGEPYQKELGDYYASCMDVPAIDKLGIKPLDPWLAPIGQLNTPASITKMLGKLAGDGIPNALDLSAAQSFEDSTRTVAMVWQGGLGMPEREYYLDNAPKLVELRTKYEAHVTAMLVLSGETDANAKSQAKRILDVETQIAKAWMTKEDRREPKKIAHPAKKDDLTKVAPGFDWPTYLDGAGQSKLPEFNIGQPDYAKALGDLVNGKVTVADWKIYLRWSVLRFFGNDLGQKFVDEKFKWRSAVSGAEKLPPRWKRCVRGVDEDMGQALAQPFVKKTLGSEGKQDVIDMVKAIEEAMHQNLETVSWMDEGTRKAAFVKLSKIANKIAYPDKWRSYQGLVITRADFPGNVSRAATFEQRRQMAKVGKPIDRTEWMMSPPTIDAYYDAQLNEMVFPAGILQPPFYAKASPVPVNFGGVGMVMGHELTHGFDDEGRQFDGDGNLKDWWTGPVNTEFERRAECVKKQYDDYVVLGDLHINGKLTLGENIADLGGVKLALKAMKTKKGAASDRAADQAFFVSYAQGWCIKEREETQRTRIATNPHSPGNLRVNGPVSNIPEFAQAFSCKPGSKMVRANRCEVW